MISIMIVSQIPQVIHNVYSITCSYPDQCLSMSISAFGFYNYINLWVL